MSDTTDDLATLLPAREVTVAGETLTVLPFKFGTLPKAVKLMQPLAGALNSAQIISFDSKGTFTLAGDWPLKLPQIVAEGGDALIELLVFVTKKPRAWFDDLDIDEGIKLTRAVLEVNSDFFVRKIVPMLPVAINSTAEAASTDGEPSLAA